MVKVRVENKLPKKAVSKTVVEVSLALNSAMSFEPHLSLPQALLLWDPRLSYFSKGPCKS